MAKRKAISKRTRFEVFKRDSFICQYCGSTPPKVVLHLDHIVPVSKGGDNLEGNLVTACDACNLGKSDVSLTSVPKSLAERQRHVQETEEQLEGYVQVMADQKQRAERHAWMVGDIFCEQFYEKSSIRRDWFRSIMGFNNKLGVVKVMEAVESAIDRVPVKDYQCFKYFCGICWTMIKEDRDA
jgi:hypothetical protein